jgi:hypothetical protein
METEQPPIIKTEQPPHTNGNGNGNGDSKIFNVSVRGLIAVIVVSTVCAVGAYVGFKTTAVPDVLKDLALICIGYFFAKVVTK